MTSEQVLEQIGVLVLLPFPFYCHSPITHHIMYCNPLFLAAATPLVQKGKYAEGQEGRAAARTAIAISEL